LTDELLNMLIWEGGPLETAQVMLYIAAASVSFFYARRKIWADGFSGAFILLLFVMRELDFQKKFTGVSITRTKYYFNYDAPLLSKIFFGLLIIFLVSFIASFIIRHWKQFIYSIKKRETWALFLLCGVIFILLANVTDSSPRILKTMGIQPSDKIHLFKNLVEELFELAIPAFFLLSLIYYRKTYLSK